jgi:hypothetical protein
MRTPPSRRLPTLSGPDAGVSYVADNESDAQALCQQMGGLVDIRQRVVREIPYVPPATGQTSRTPSRPDVPSVHRKRL